MYKYFYGMIMIIGATADLHLPNNYREFIAALDKVNYNFDLFLLAGDIINGKNVEDFERFYNSLFGKVECPIVMVFGNNEYTETRTYLKLKYQDIIFLEDESVILKIKDRIVGIFGSTGVLDKPTPWQLKNVPGIEEIYKARLERIKQGLNKLIVDYKILLLHYAPTYSTLEGEPPFSYPSLGSKKMENVIKETKPDLVIHGHSHKGKPFSLVHGVPVFNVAFPANNNRVVVINTEEVKPGLLKFINP